jgi:hypothetical protein
MKIILKISIFIIVTVLIFQGCKCYPCVAKGDSFDLPYVDSQTISFVNDSLITKSYLILKETHLPPSEYCGEVGSSSYQECSGESSVSFFNYLDKATVIKINYMTDGSSDGVELPVFKEIIVYNRRLEILQNRAYSPDQGGIVRTINSIILNNKSYSNLIEFYKNNDSIKVNECGYILYSKTDGILRYNIKKTNYIETWTIKK